MPDATPMHKMRRAATIAALATAPWAVAGAAEFRLEPADRTRIGVNQSITAFAVFQEPGNDPYPRYVDPARVAWTSSQPGCARVSPQGVVTGITECRSVIEARYLGLSSRLVVDVSGRWIERRVNVAGQGQRRYAVYLPNHLRPGVPPAVVIAMHGGGGTAMSQAATSQLAEAAHERRLIAAFVEGSGPIQTFNAGACCGAAQTRGIDDTAFVRRVIDDLIAQDGIDPARVLATGFSNGGMMAHRLACELPDRIAAVAALGGGSGEFDALGRRYYRCEPAHPIPVLHFHATNDRNYPIEGGRGDGISSTPFYSIAATIADWRKRNNVMARARVERLGASTVCEHHEQPADPRQPSARVTLCTTDPTDVYDAATGIVFGGGHSWPGGVKSRAAGSDVPVADVDANAAIGTWVLGR